MKHVAIKNNCRYLKMCTNHCLTNAKALYQGQWYAQKEYSLAGPWKVGVTFRRIYDTSAKNFFFFNSYNYSKHVGSHLSHINLYQCVHQTLMVSADMKWLFDAHWQIIKGLQVWFHLTSLWKQCSKKRQYGQNVGFRCLLTGCKVLLQGVMNILLTRLIK